MFCPLQPIESNKYYFVKVIANKHIFQVITAIIISIILPFSLQASEKKTEFEVQALLNALGYDIGGIDGIFGAKSKSALVQFENANKIGIALKLEESTTSLLSEKYFGKKFVPINVDWNGNFIVPLDILKEFNLASQKKINFLCGKNPESSANRLNDNLKRPIPLRLSGYNSRMDNRINVPHAEQLSLATIDFSHLATIAMGGISETYTEDAMKLLFYWASGGAFLDTVQCTDSGVLKKECTEWTQQDGQDLSLIKDHGTVQMEMMHLSYGYYMSLANKNVSDPRHIVIQKWFGEFFQRNKSPDTKNLTFGTDHAWSWPKILQNQIEGKSSINLIKSLLNHIDQNVFEDGSIKDRTTRGNRALWYHHDGMKEILVTLEIARRHGLKIPDKLHKKVEKAGELFLKGFQDNSYLDKWAEVAHNAIHEPGYQDFKSSITDMPNNNSWFYIFAYRYPNSTVTDELLSLIYEGQDETLGSKDGQIGFGLGCVYSAINDNILLPQLTDKISTLSFDKVNIIERPKRMTSETETFQELNVKLTNVSLDGEFMGNPHFSILLDFKNHMYKHSKTYLYRIQFPTKSLKSDALLDVKDCYHITYRENNGQVEALRYLIGNGARFNECILKLMQPKRVEFLKSLENSLPSVIDRGLAHVPDRREFHMLALEKAQNQ